MDQQPLNNYNATLPTSNLATISLVAGILGFTLFPVVGGIAAIIMGYAARKETRAVPPLVSGDGLATAGIVMGWIQVAMAVVGACCFIAFFVLLAGVAGVSVNQ